MPTDSPAVPTPPPPMAAATRPRGTLAGRIGLVTTAVALMTAIIVAAVAVPQLRAAGQAQARANLERLADTVATTADGFDMRGPRRGPMAPRGGDISWQVVAPGEPVPAFLDESDLAQLESTGELTTVADDSSVVVVGRVLSDGSLLLLSEPVTYSGAAVAEDISRLLIALSAGVLIAALAGVVLARWLARPLKVAAAAAEEMAAGSRDVELVPQGPVEVAEVAESLNGLNAALTASEARQREFLLSVSHELRTPMTTLRGYAEALADGVVEPQNAAATGAVMVSESDRLERLITDLLDLARMGAREVRVEVVNVDAGEVLRNTATVWADMCAREGVRFHSELPEEPLYVRTDPDRLRQILDNLLTNALRMTPAGGPIVLAAGPDSNSAVASTSGPGGIWVQVRDGGPGLTDADLAVAFEPAVLYSRYRGERPVGSGVGLALVGRLVQRLGGSVTAEHAAEGGAAFTVYLPAEAPAAIGSST